MQHWLIKITCQPGRLDGNQLDRLDKPLPSFTTVSYDSATGTAIIDIRTAAATPWDALDQAKGWVNAAAVALTGRLWNVTDIRVVEIEPLADGRRDSAEPEPVELIGFAQVAEILGMSRQGARHQATHDHRFPKPLAQTKTAKGLVPLYTAASIEGYRTTREAKKETR